MEYTLIREFCYTNKMRKPTPDQLEALLKIRNKLKVTIATLEADVEEQEALGDIRKQYHIFEYRNIVLTPDNWKDRILCFFGIKKRKRVSSEEYILNAVRKNLEDARTALAKIEEMQGVRDIVQSENLGIL